MFATWLMLAGLVGAVWTAIPPQPGGDAVRRSVAAVVLTTALVLAAPVPDQVFLWVSGIGTIGTSLVFAVAAVAAARRSLSAFGRGRAAWLGAGSLAAIFTSGCYETTGFLLVIMSAGVAVGFGWKKTPQLVAAGAVGSGAMLGILVVAWFPGTAVRKSVLAGLPAGAAVESGWHATMTVVASIVGMEGVWIAFGAGLLCAAPYLPPLRLAWWGVVGLAATVVALWASLALSAWTTGGLPPGRTVTVLVAAVCAYAFMLGWLVPVRRWGGTAVVFGLVVVISLASRGLYDRVDDRRAWADAWDRRDALLRSAPDGATVEVPTLSSPGGLDDLTGDPASWVNAAAARYYRLDAIVAVPAP